MCILACNSNISETVLVVPGTFHVYTFTLKNTWLSYMCFLKTLYRYIACLPLLLLILIYIYSCGSVEGFQFDVVIYCAFIGLVDFSCQSQHQELCQSAGYIYCLLGILLLEVLSILSWFLCKVQDSVPLSFFCMWLSSIF